MLVSRYPGLLCACCVIYQDLCTLVDSFKRPFRPRPSRIRELVVNFRSHSSCKVDVRAPYEYVLGFEPARRPGVIKSLHHNTIM